MPILGVAVTFDARCVKAISMGVMSKKNNTKWPIDGQAKALARTGIDFNGGSDYRVTPIAVARHHSGSGDEIKKEQ